MSRQSDALRCIKSSGMQCWITVCSGKIFCIVGVLCSCYAKKYFCILCYFFEKKKLYWVIRATTIVSFYSEFLVFFRDLLFIYILGLSKHLVIPIILTKTKTEQHVSGIVEHFKSTPSQEYKIKPF